MPNWTAFAAITIVVLFLLLVLSHLTQSVFSESGDSDSIDRPESDRSVNGEEHVSRAGSSTVEDENEDDSPPTNASESESVSSSSGHSQASTPVPDSADTDTTRSGPAALDQPRAEPDAPDPSEMSTEMLLANVALSQGVFAIILIGAAIYTGIPAEALGLEFSQSYLVAGLVIGTGLGIALYVANEIGAAISTWFGLDHDEDLRELLGPDSVKEWVVLLVFVLPIIAVFEELLFRAALIGVFEAGFEISPWFLAVVSSIAFGVGHGMQGSVGVIVTGALGFVLAAAFVITGSFLVVVVAHYLINAFEFVVHEGLGFDWAAVLETEGGGG